MRRVKWHNSRMDDAKAAENFGMATTGTGGGGGCGGTGAKMKINAFDILC